MMIRNPMDRCGWCGVDNGGHATWCVYSPYRDHTPRVGVFIFGEKQLEDRDLLSRMRIQGERPITTSGRKVL